MMKTRTVKEKQKLLDALVSSYVDFHKHPDKSVIMSTPTTIQPPMTMVSVDRRRMATIIHPILSRLLTYSGCLHFVDWSNEENEQPIVAFAQKTPRVMIKLDKRINQNDQDSQVYSAVLSTPGRPNLKHTIAVKVSPITRKVGYIQNQVEAKLMMQASDLVLQGRTNHFLVVYGTTRCVDTELPLAPMYDDPVAHIATHFGYMEKLVEHVYASKKGMSEKDIFEEIPYDISAFSSLTAEIMKDSSVNLSKYAKHFSDESAIDIENVVKNMFYDVAIYEERLALQKAKKMWSVSSPGRKFPYVDLTANVRASMVMMEYADTDLQTVLTTKEEISVNEFFDYFIQISNALFEFHTILKHTHRNMKSSNVLLLNDYRPSSGRIKIRCVITGMKNAIPIDFDDEPKSISPSEDLLSILNHMRIDLSENGSLNEKTSQTRDLAAYIYTECLKDVNDYGMEPYADNSVRQLVTKVVKGRPILTLLMSEHEKYQPKQLADVSAPKDMPLALTTIFSSEGQISSLSEISPKWTSNVLQYIEKGNIK